MAVEVAAKFSTTKTLQEPRYVRIYCDSASRREVERSAPGNEWNRTHTRKVGLTLAEKVEGRWRCRCCGKPVSVVW